MANATYRLRGTNSAGAALYVDIQTDNGSSDANAKTMAQSVSTLLGTAVTLYDSAGVVINAYTPGTQGTTVTSVTCSVVSAI